MVRAAAVPGRWELSGKVCACVCAASVQPGKAVEWQKAMTVLTHLVSYPSLLLPADAHTEFYRRKRLVGTRLLNCLHIAVPKSLGVNAGSIISLPDGAEQDKRVSLCSRHAFPWPPLRLRHPTVCVIPRGTVFLPPNTGGN